METRGAASRGAEGRRAIEERREMMLREPVERLICRLAVPSILTMMISAAYNAADTYFVSALGTSEIAGVGVVLPLMTLIQAFGFFFGQGCGNFASRHLGGGDVDGALRITATALIMAAVCGALIAGAGLAMPARIARLLGATPTVEPHAAAYMRYILPAAPFMTASLVMNVLFRHQGSSLRGMFGMGAGALLNIALDPIFIFALDMGVEGAALATLISQAAGFVVLMAGMGRGGSVPFRPRLFTPSAYYLREMLRGGIPSLARQGMASVAVAFVNRSAAPYGDAAIASFAIVMRVFMLANAVIIGFGQGFQPVCGFNWGAGRYDRVRRARGFCVRVGVSLMLVVGAVCALFAPRVIAFFRADDPEVVRIGARSLRLLCAMFPLMSVVVIDNMMQQTAGFAAHATFLALARQGLFLVPALFILQPSLGLLGVQLAIPIADAITVACAIPLGASVMREMARREARAEKKSGLDRPLVRS